MVATYTEILKHQGMVTDIPLKYAVIRSFVKTVYMYRVFVFFKLIAKSQLLHTQYKIIH